MDSWVYILKFDNRIKIGYTTRTIEKRIKEIENTSGERVEDFFYTNAPQSIERELHIIYKAYRTVGEYFLVSYDDAVNTLLKIAPTQTSKNQNAFSNSLKVCYYMNDYQYLSDFLKDIESQGHILPSNVKNKIRLGTLDFKTIAIFLECLGYEIIFQKKKDNSALDRKSYFLEVPH